MRSCHGVGKTRTAAWAALWFLLTHFDSRVVTTAPTWRQVKDLLWSEIAKAWGASRIPLPDKPLTTTYHLTPDWFAVGLSTDKPEQFQGYHANDLLVIVDEASGVEQTIFDAIEGLMATQGARLLLVGNPTQLAGTFYQAFRSPLYHTIHISYQDSPNFQGQGVVRPYLITPEWVEERRTEWGEQSPLWQSRVLGDFPTQGEDTLIPLAWIEAAQTRYPEMPAGEPVALGVDVARYGADSTIIVERIGPRARVIAVHHGLDTMAVAGEVANALRIRPGVTAYVDVVGVGAGVVDALQEQGLPVEGLNAGSSPRDSEQFINTRAEWFWGLRERFREGTIGIDPADDVLAAHLACLRYKYDSRGRLHIESKDDMKKRGLPSPDRADALMLAFAGEGAVITPTYQIGWL